MKWKKVEIKNCGAKVQEKEREKKDDDENDFYL